ncbi:MAG: O-acetylhomoserine aminocarboxypropyltransferase [Hyphomicrobiales bacterium]|nr:MAG: O-acetylhomoserine aminocarboxypropyltransferase [Hyphomicrobiales bacterium]
MSDTQKIETLAVHAGAKADPTTKARATPIYQTTAYEFDSSEHAANLFALKEFGNIYTRIMNPTQAVLEERVAALEGGTAALAVASGHAAQLVIMHTLLESGDEFLAANQLYGGSINQFGESFKKFGWKVNWADATDPAAMKAALTPKTKAIHIESLANPGGIVIDIAAIAKIANEAGIPLIVDNTLASPYLCRPIEHGAHIVVHSATKFLGGHGNSMGGVIVDGGNFDWGKDKKYPSLCEPLQSYNGLVLWDALGNISFAIACRVLGLRDLGPAISPMNAFLIQTGIETLAVRMDRHVANAQKVAEHLQGHDKVESVSYAGLPDSPYFDLAKKYLPKGAGSILTFNLKGGYDAGVKLVETVELFSHLANVGDTRSLIIHPAATTHAQLTEEQRIACGAASGFIRLSIGIEHVDDIIADLDKHLAAL